MITSYLLFNALILYTLIEQASLYVLGLTVAIFLTLNYLAHRRLTLKIILILTLPLGIFIGISAYVIAFLLAINLFILAKIAKSEEFAVDLVSLCIYEKHNSISKMIIRVKKLNPNYPVGQSQSLTTYALEKGNIAFAKYLISLGADTDKKTVNGLTIKEYFEDKSAILSSKGVN